MIQLLFVIDNINAMLALQPYADYKGISFIFAKTLPEVLNFVCSQKVDALIVDQWFAEASDLQAALASHKTPLFWMGAVKDIATSPVEVSGLLASPVDVSVLEKLLRDIEGAELSPVSIGADTQCGELIGTSVAMLKLYHKIRKVAPIDASVFIVGQTGSGKELVAKAIQQLSPRANQPYIAINCGAMNDELLSSTLFGHEKGSFTGAIQNYKGFFEQASGGTLFLDEVTETSQYLQISLLRVLETQQVTPVGAKRSVRVDVRVLASTNRDPLTAIRKRLLREDLYHRLNVFPIEVPALAEHRDDIDKLVAHFLRQYNEQYQWRKRISTAAMALLIGLSYSGNVRQLKNLIYRAMILADDVIEPEHLE